MTSLRPVVLISSVIVAAAVVAIAACSQTPSTPASAPSDKPASVSSDAVPKDSSAASPGGSSASGDVALPPGSASAWNNAQSDGKSPAVDRGIDDYRAIIQNNRDKFRDCYDTSLKAHPAIKGRVTLKFILNPDGSVKEGEIDKGASDITLADLEQCMMKAVKSLSFPPSKRRMESEVRYPFEFKPDGKKSGGKKG